MLIQIMLGVLQFSTHPQIQRYSLNEKRSFESYNLTSNRPHTIIGVETLYGSSSYTSASSFSQISPPRLNKHSKIRESNFSFIPSLLLTMAEESLLNETTSRLDTFDLRRDSTYGSGRVFSNLTCFTNWISNRRGLTRPDTNISIRMAKIELLLNENSDIYLYSFQESFDQLKDLVKELLLFANECCDYTTQCEFLHFLKIKFKKIILSLIIPNVNSLLNISKNQTLNTINYLIETVFQLSVNCSVNRTSNHSSYEEPINVSIDRATTLMLIRSIEGSISSYEEELENNHSNLKDEHLVYNLKYNISELFKSMEIVITNSDQWSLIFEYLTIKVLKQHSALTNDFEFLKIFVKRLQNFDQIVFSQNILNTSYFDQKIYMKSIFQEFILRLAEFPPWSFLSIDSYIENLHLFSNAYNNVYENELTLQNTSSHTVIKNSNFENFTLDSGNFRHFLNKPTLEITDDEVATQYVSQEGKTDLESIGNHPHPAWMSRFGPMKLDTVEPSFIRRSQPQLHKADEDKEELGLKRNSRFIFDSIELNKLKRRELVKSGTNIGIFSDWDTDVPLLSTSCPAVSALSSNDNYVHVENINDIDCLGYEAQESELDQNFSNELKVKDSSSQLSDVEKDDKRVSVSLQERRIQQASKSFKGHSNQEKKIRFRQAASNIPKKLKKTFTKLFK
ncbi:hypothetical protein HYPBUDRAFT_236559 [Hyphopichia burtonii NRRL Y-1933]|uniref:Uncharacterized protein n=1 Tax=Hyphopichia burtonii NRRL Y-1933 TaxID=984485 RepID=A0A1E4RS12_9ASCO|nr:hypothetical protein HYPBUDRAFT_236559 [Hyphopichia burtonii NRRL Y-1933]ODV69855.1 hypothetical protein HYPBUDRAFT_236559 [Hyphopichia burtonii NRRL Y-1933]